ncbi:MAG: hypothetical protein NW223_16985 [Hyphomicrobiaceae bacterium]|nr:hypothetical protein [Hyphomicrobiaceae bacterium]
MVARALTSDGTPPAALTVPEFLAWVKDRPGRFELHDGQVVAMAPERVGHAATRFAAQRALLDAGAAAKLDCHVLPDGGAVHIDDLEVASIRHDLIVPSVAGAVVHHQGRSDGNILTRIINAGALRLDPPGLELDVSAFFA